MFRLYRSNRTERLIEALAEVVGRRLDDPFAREQIVVQGRGMERWLSMQLARRLGIWANPSFPFPRKVIDEAMQAVLGTPGEASAAYEPESLRWSVAGLLPALLPQPAFKPLRDYLAEDERGVKRMQLATRIATTFDHYVVYRPDLIKRWEAERLEEWQPLLWREIVGRHGPHHFAARARLLLEALRSWTAGGPPAGKRIDGSFGPVAGEPPALREAALPARLSLFGLSTLPPLYVELLRALSAVVDVHLFLLSPSREYWGDIRDRKSLLREALHHDGHLPIEAELVATEGHPLLASLGRLGREFQQVLESSVDYEEDGGDLYEVPAEGTLLGTLQADIVLLQTRAAGSALEPLPLLPRDDSIRIHSCHGPLREIEVLYDRLLALFDADATLEPRDVIVMTPSIDAYAPCIEAVFRPSGEERARIPYRIADRSTRATEEVSDALFRVLDVLDGRLAASEVLDLLAIEDVRRRARLSVDDVDLVREWIVQAGIRWGVDAAHRVELGQPRLEQNTWRFGLDRLLLGYALPGDGRELPYGVLPHADVEGSETAALGRLAELCQVLFRQRAALRQARPMGEWRDHLAALLAETVAQTNLNAFQHQRLRDALAALARRAEAAEMREPLHLEVVRDQLEDELHAGTSAQGFLSGGVTFCELVPMRTIPFRVVCLVGMNDGAFPRQARPLGFDLVAAHPRAGDRNVREDDRYLFLEALLSAREKLLITYVGQSITDNSPLPPSVVVSELLDAVDRTFVREETEEEKGANQVIGVPGPPSSAIVIRHPLQPFSPRNFGSGDDADHFSYSIPHGHGAVALAQAAHGVHSVAPPFIAAPLALRDAASREVTVDQLARFFEHPTRAFLQNRLGLYLGRDLEAVEDREPLQLNALNEWAIGDGLLRLCGTPEDVEATLAREVARGLLPPGALGIASFKSIATVAHDLLTRAAPLRAGARRTLEIDVGVGDTRITGALRDLWPAGLLRCQYSRLGKRHELGFWIRHLLLQLCATSDTAPVSRIVGRPEKKSKKKGAATGVTLRFRPVADAASQLALLVDLYWLGQRWPLPYFEGASRAYATTLRQAKKNDEHSAIGAARESFDGGEESFGQDSHDANVCQVYGADVTFDDMRQAPAQPRAGFEELARKILSPLLDHREIDA